jgi:predicted P-loop ATPase
MPDDTGKLIDLASRKPVEELTYLNRLKTGTDGTVFATVSNAMILLLNDPILKGMAAYNEFACRAVLTRPPPETERKTTPGPFPRSWDRADEAFVQSYFQAVHNDNFNAPIVGTAMTGAASGNRFHPVQDYLDGLKWDGTRRASVWLHAVFGCPSDAYHHAVATKFLSAAVRRVRHPGCKFDAMLLLEGEQNIGKSRACRALFGEEWFTDTLPSDLRGRDAADALTGVWGVEFSEIEHLLRSEPEEVKAFLSRQIDRYHPRYGRDVVLRPRQCVFIGTTNRDDYARDSTGNRRLWPVTCTQVNVEWIEKHRDQLWAEACELEPSAKLWLIETDANAQATERQAQRYQEDPWEEQIAGFITLRAEIGIPEILQECLKLQTDRQDKRAQMRVADILRSRGWRRNTGGSIGRKWVKTANL